MSEFNPVLYFDCLNVVRAMSDAEFFSSQHNFNTKNWSVAWRIEYKRRFQ